MGPVSPESAWPMTIDIHFLYISFPQITDEYSSLIVAQLLFLQSEDTLKPINMYINSPGKCVLQ